MFVSSIIYQSIYIGVVLETSPKKQKTICNFCNFPIGNKKPRKPTTSVISAIKVGGLGTAWRDDKLFANPFAHHKKSHSEGA